MQNHANSMSFLKIPRGRRELLGMAGLAALMFAFQPHGAAAQETGGEAGGGHSGGGESGGGHTGGGESGGGHSGGGESGGGESEGKHGAGKTPGERARRHRQRTGKTLGGGESGGGHTGGGGGEDGGTVLPPDGSTSGPIGGGSGGEHFIHEGQGGWGADNKVLRSP